MMQERVLLKVPSFVNNRPSFVYVFYVGGGFIHCIVGWRSGPAVFSLSVESGCTAHGFLRLGADALLSLMSYVRDSSSTADVRWGTPIPLCLGVDEFSYEFPSWRFFYPDIDAYLKAYGFSIISIE